MIEIRLRDLKSMVPHRPAGYLDEVLSKGELRGEYLVIPRSVFRSLVRKYAADEPVGLGDIVQSIAKPIARVIDRVFGTKLAHCAACEKRRKWLNDHARL